ncbi:MAG TPA: hypothetical protein VFC78_17670 [Tepidisphaeraceae bacterium]|nr:hypothetical protein [Tepidisphaeraceae bacterium]
MKPEIELIIWTALLSVVIAYAWFVHFRVWALRQDLFEIRDCLWDEMRQIQSLDDRSHQELRNSINAMIRFAPWLSFISLWRVLFGGTTQSIRPADDVPEPIMRMRAAVLERIVRYLLRETITGLLFSLTANIYRSKRLVEGQISRWVGRLIESKEIRQIDPRVARHAKSQGI